MQLQRLESTHFFPTGFVAVSLLWCKKDSMHNITGVILLTLQDMVCLTSLEHYLVSAAQSSKALPPCTWVHSLLSWGGMHPLGQDPSPTLLPSCPPARRHDFFCKCETHCAGAPSLQRLASP